MVFSGRCACGAVRYTIAAVPIRGFQCQCGDCQRDTGSGHSSVFVFARNAVSVTGEVREIARMADSGAVKRKGFCPNCGSPIYNQPDEKPEYIGIYVRHAGRCQHLQAIHRAVLLARLRLGSSRSRHPQTAEMAYRIEIAGGRDRLNRRPCHDDHRRFGLRG